MRGRACGGSGCPELRAHVAAGARAGLCTLPLSRPGCLVCPWVAARPLAVRAASFARRVGSLSGQALPPPTGIAAWLSGSLRTGAGGVFGLQDKTCWFCGDFSACWCGKVGVVGGGSQLEGWTYRVAGAVTLRPCCAGKSRLWVVAFASFLSLLHRTPRMAAQ